MLKFVLTENRLLKRLMKYTYKARIERRAVRSFQKMRRLAWQFVLAQTHPHRSSRVRQKSRPRDWHYPLETQTAIRPHSPALQPAGESIATVNAYFEIFVDDKSFRGPFRSH